MQVSDLMARIKKLEKARTRAFVIRQRPEALSVCVSQQTPKNVRVELKKFERDILVMLDNQQDRINEAAAGETLATAALC